MANIKDKMLYFVGNKLLKYVYKNPQKNMLKLIKIGKAVAGKMYPESTFTSLSKLSATLPMFGINIYLTA